MYGKIMMNFSNRVYEYVKTVPKGKVVSYGQVALAIGAPRASRQVGWALHANPMPGIVPCHRVVFKNGSLCKGFAFGGESAQRALLQEEGIVFRADGTIDMQQYRWQGEI